MARNTAVATVEEKPVSVIVPSFMSAYAGEGTEGITAADMEIPRIKLLQALSPELQDRDDLKQGYFFHTIAEESLGKSLQIIPLLVNQTYILWNPRESGGGILARSEDGKTWDKPNMAFTVKLKGGKSVIWYTKENVVASGLSDWGSSDPDNPDSQPALTKLYNLVVFLPDFPELSPSVVSLQRSSIKAARKLLGKLSISRAPSYGQQFVMSSISETNDQNQPYFNYKFVGDGLVQDEDEFNAYRDMYNHFKKVGVKVKDMEEEYQSPTVGDNSEF